MPRKDTSRALTIKQETYLKLFAHAKRMKKSMSQAVEEILLAAVDSNKGDRK